MATFTNWNSGNLYPPYGTEAATPAWTDEDAIRHQRPGPYMEAIRNAVANRKSVLLKYGISHGVSDGRLLFPWGWNPIRDTVDGDLTYDELFPLVEDTLDILIPQFYDASKTPPPAWTEADILTAIGASRARFMDLPRAAWCYQQKAIIERLWYAPSLAVVVFGNYVSWGSSGWNTWWTPFANTLARMAAGRNYHCFLVDCGNPYYKMTVSGLTGDLAGYNGDYWYSFADESTGYFCLAGRGAGGVYFEQHYRHDLVPTTWLVEFSMYAGTGPPYGSPTLKLAGYANGALDDFEGPFTINSRTPNDARTAGAAISASVDYRDNAGEWLYRSSSGYQPAYKAAFEGEACTTRIAMPYWDQAELNTEPTRFSAETAGDHMTFEELYAACGLSAYSAIVPIKRPAWFSDDGNIDNDEWPAGLPVSATPYAAYGGGDALTPPGWTAWLAQLRTLGHHIDVTASASYAYFLSHFAYWLDSEALQQDTAHIGNDPAWVLPLPV